ncbi:FAD-dependent monooxygenase [Pigmentiphaga sp. YJ18]|uniref:FAD-dependent monooxygenase n=1 Tax=Pigmentiphaga sp. YJ18 TaxID=3134907 RepID=UPI00310FDF85
MTQHVAIIGAGIGGLAAALALLRRGIDVDVYEQATDLKEVGAGIQTTPNGSRVLLELGLGDELQRYATFSKGKDTYLWNTGQKRPFMPLGEQSVDSYGAPYVTFHRADLHGMLLRAVLQAKPGAVHLGKQLDALSQDDRGVRMRFVDGSEATAPLMVGADGIHSRVRQILLGPDKPAFTGCMAWRGLIPAEAIQGTIDLVGGSMWLGPTAHIVTYPVRQGKLLNFIGMVDQDNWLIESWNAAGTTEECLADFAGWHPHVQRMVRNITIPYKWALMVRAPLERWTDGRITLLGDACHSTLPFLSQGANMALEDGLILARCLQAYGEDAGHALRSYEALRRPRTANITRSSAEQVRRVHNPELADPAEAQRYIEREWGQQQVEERYRWIYGYDARTVSLESAA